MTNVERKAAAISYAVRKAVHSMGRDGIKRGEFFGMKQRRKQKAKKAA